MGTLISCSISGSNVTSNFTSTSYSGALIARTETTDLNNCSSFNNNIIATSQTANVYSSGIVGDQIGGNIQYCNSSQNYISSTCFFSSNLNSYAYLAGIASSQSSNGLIENCYSSNYIAAFEECYFLSGRYAAPKTYSAGIVSVQKSSKIISSITYNAFIHSYSSSQYFAHSFSAGKKKKIISNLLIFFF